MKTRVAWTIDFKGKTYRFAPGDEVPKKLQQTARNLGIAVETEAPCAPETSEPE